jgi:hypothetical protein
MATISVIADLTKTPLTRQDIHDAWTTAALGSIVQADLASDFMSVTPVSSFTDIGGVQPGQLQWVANEQLMYCYHDEIDDTGVSLWLAIGPDMFETACLLAEPAWPGALVEPTFDRWVAPVAYTDSAVGDGVNNRMIGNVHTGVPYPLNSETPETIASGTWVRVGIDGFVYGWIPNASGISDALFAIPGGGGVGAAPIDASRDATRMKGGMIKTVASGGRHGTVHPYLGFCGVQLGAHFNNVSQTDWGTHIRYRFIGFNDQQDRTP